MSEELESVLAELVKKSINAVETGGQWALDKAPELVEQFLMWELWSNVIGAVICLIIIVSQKWTYPITRKARDDFNVDVAFLGTAWAAAASIAIIAFVAFLYHIVHILVAPEIYLIKEFL